MRNKCAHFDVIRQNLIITHSRPHHCDKAVTITTIVPWKAEVCQLSAVALKSHMKPITL